MDSNSQILEAVSTLENEMNSLSARLEPVTLPAAPTQGGVSTQPEPSRSQVSQRLTNLIRQVRDIQARLEV